MIVCYHSLQARSQGGSLGVKEPPSQIKGPQICKKSTILLKRYTNLLKGPVFC